MTSILPHGFNNPFRWISHTSLSPALISSLVPHSSSQLSCGHAHWIVPYASSKTQYAQYRIQYLFSSSHLLLLYLLHSHRRHKYGSHLNLLPLFHSKDPDKQKSCQFCLPRVFLNPSPAFVSIMTALLTFLLYCHSILTATCFCLFPLKFILCSGTSMT